MPVLDVPKNAEAATPSNYDGSSLLIMGQGTDTVYSYNVDPGFNVSEAVLSTSLDVSANTVTGTDVMYNDDGTKLYTLDDDDNSIEQYALSNPFDVSSGSHEKNFSLTPSGTSPQGFIFNDDGSKIYVAHTSGTGNITEVLLSTPYDVGTASIGDDFSVDSQDTSPQAVRWNNDGSQLYIVGGSTDLVYQYNASTAYDVTSLTFDTSSQALEDQFVTGMDWNGDGSKLYVLTNGADVVTEYDATTSFDIREITSVDNASAASEDTVTAGMGWGGGGPPPGLDTLSPTATDQLSTFGLRDIRTDWTLDNAGHEVYVREIRGGSGPGAKVTVYNPSLSVLRGGFPCTGGGLIEEPSAVEFAVTKEASERLVWPCIDDTGSDALVLANGTTFDYINQVNLDPAVAAPYSPRSLECADANRCISSNSEETHLVRIDPLNGRVNWARGFAGVRDVDVDLDNATRYAATGESGTRLYGPSAAIEAERTDLDFAAVATYEDKLWIGNSLAVRQYNISGGSLNFCCGNTSLAAEELGLRTSKDGQWLMAWDNDRAHVVEPDSLRAVVRVDPPGSIVAADMDLNNSALYVINATHVHAYDLTGTNVTATTQTQPPATNGTETDTLEPGGTATGVDLISQWIQGVKSGFGGTDERAAWLLGILFMLGLGGATFALVKSPTSFGIGAFAGIGLGVGLGLLPLWFPFTLALVALAIVVTRGTL